MRLSFGLGLYDLLRARPSGTPGPPPSTLLDGLVSYWTLDELSGVRYDTINYPDGNNLTDNNTVGYSIAGQSGTAASFVAGNLEWLSHATPVIPADSDFTVAHWQFVAAGETSTGMIPWKTNGSLQNDQHGVFFEPVNGANHRLYNRRGYGTGIEIGDNRGAWILVIYQYVIGTTTSKVMGMGTAENSGVWSADSVNAEGNNTEFDIGGPDAVYMNGKIDEVAVWSRVLTDDERTELYNSGAGKFYPFS